METQATSKYLRISAFKVRQVTRLIQGRPAIQALATLELMPRKAARLTAKTLKSAIANAENNHEMVGEDLVVKEAIVGEGSTMRRFRPKARGMAGRIRKRTSHIKITVSDQVS